MDEALNCLMFQAKGKGLAEQQAAKKSLQRVLGRKRWEGRGIPERKVARILVAPRHPAP